MKELSKEDLLRRIKFINEDVLNIIKQLDVLDIKTDIEINGTSIDTYISNILVCTDIEDGKVDHEGQRVEDEWILIQK